MIKHDAEKLPWRKTGSNKIKKMKTLSQFELTKSDLGKLIGGRATPVTNTPAGDRTWGAGTPLETSFTFTSDCTENGVTEFYGVCYTR